MPTPRANPPSDMMFRVILPKKRRLKVAMMEMGKMMPMIRGVLTSWRKRRRTMKARMAPSTISPAVVAMASSMD
jgi:hypothetical protein